MSVGSVDCVLMFCNIYNWYMWGGGEEWLIFVFKVFFIVFKFGGILGVVEYCLFEFRLIDDMEFSGYM